VPRRPAHRRTTEPATTDSFVGLRGLTRGLGSFRLTGRRHSVRVSITAERPRELTFRFGPVRSTRREGPLSPADRRTRFGPIELRVRTPPVEVAVSYAGEPVFESATELPPGKLPGPGRWGAKG